MADIIAKKSDLYDERPVLKYAAKQAVSLGVDRYVISKNGRWTYSVKPPGPRWTHWKVDHMGELYAHMGGMNVTEYLYEKAN